MEEIEIKISVGKYPKENFTGILKAIFPSETKKGKEVLKIQCVDGSEIMVTGLGAVTKEETPGFMGVGIFVKSLLESMKAAGIKNPVAKWVWDGNQIMAFKTEPDYSGATCDFKVTASPPKIGDEKTEYPPTWEIIKYVPPAATYKPYGNEPVPTGPKSEKPVPGPAQDFTARWSELCENLPGAMRVAEVVRYLKENTPCNSAPAKEVQKVLDNLVADGFLVKENNTYKKAI